jgi:hypothetical protein
MFMFQRIEEAEGGVGQGQGLFSPVSDHPPGLAGS